MLKAYIITLAIMSFVTNQIYSYDDAVSVGKWRHRNRQRIPVYVLMTLTALGGGFGGLCAMTVQRHKAGGDNKPFRWVVGASIIMSLITIVILITAEL